MTREERKRRGRAEQEAIFERYRERLKFELTRLACFTKLFRVVVESERAHWPAMQLAPAFFSTVKESLRSSSIVGIQRLVAQPRDRNEWTFESFLDFVEANVWMFASCELQRRQGYPDGHWVLQAQMEHPVTREGVAVDRERLRALALTNVGRHRDKYEAHLDRAYLDDPGRLHDEAPITWGDLAAAVEVPKEIFNRYSVAYDARSFGIEPVNVGDVKRLLDFAGRARAASIAEAERVGR